MFKCKKLEYTVMLHSYLEELNKNDLTNLPKLVNIASNEKTYIEKLQNKKINYTEYNFYTIFQNVDDAKSFVLLCKIECKRLLYRNYENPAVVNIETIINQYELYSENELFSICEQILSMNEYDQYMSSHYEDEELDYEVNYEEDTETLNTLIYPYQLFL